MLIINKIDKMRPENLDPERKALIDEIINSGIDMASMSCFMDEGVMDVRNKVFQNEVLTRQ
jgi:nucleolar GTP-binding protein